MPKSTSKYQVPLQLFALSYYYPPANNPRALQVSRLLKHLDASTLLVCGDDYASDDRLDQNQRAAEDFLRGCLRVRFKQHFWKRISARAAYQFGVHLWEKSPDRYVDWKPTVLRAVDEYTKQTSYKPDLMVTFGSPMSDHLIGLSLKQRFQVPWVAHFSDPWIENPFKNYNSLTKRINVGLEKKVMSSADLVVFTSQETSDLVMAKYPEVIRSKARVLPHAFESDAYRPLLKASRSETVVRYLGDLYLQRSPAPLFRALKNIWSSEPALLAGVRFEFIGSITSLKLSETGYSEIPEGLVTFRSTVDYQTSLSLMSDSDGLLVIDAPASTSVFLPSKLIDYIGARQPIIGITPRGTAWKLIEELGGWVADPSNGPEIEQTLRSFIAFLKAKKGSANTNWGYPEVQQRYEADQVALQFHRIMDELVSPDSTRDS